MEAFLSGGADDAKLLKGPSFRDYPPKICLDDLGPASNFSLVGSRMGGDDVNA